MATGFDEDPQPVWVDLSSIRNANTFSFPPHFWNFLGELSRRFHICYRLARGLERDLTGSIYPHVPSVEIFPRLSSACSAKNKYETAESVLFYTLMNIAVSLITRGPKKQITKWDLNKSKQ